MGMNAGSTVHGLGLGSGLHAVDRIVWIVSLDGGSFGRECRTLIQSSDGPIGTRWVSDWSERWSSRLGVFRTVILEVVGSGNVCSAYDLGHKREVQHRSQRRHGTRHTG